MQTTKPKDLGGKISARSTDIYSCKHFYQALDIQAVSRELPCSLQGEPGHYHSGFC